MNYAQATERVNAAARSLIAQVTADCALRDIRGVATVGAPDTFADLCRAIEENPGAPIPVAVDAADGGIMSPADTYRFRAWHDREHYERRIGFGLRGEIAVEPFGAARLLGSDVRFLHRCEIVGQTLHYARHGRYPVDQRAFTVFAFAHGLDAAVERGGF